MLGNSGKRGGTFASSVLGFGAFATVVAQFVPQLSAVFMAIWVAFAVITGIRYRGVILFDGFPLACLFMAILLGLCCFSCFVVTSESGYVSGFFLLYIKSLLMYIVGLVAHSVIGTDRRHWNRVLAFYVVGAASYLVWALVNYFPGFSAWMSNEVYLFSSKNSMGQICAVASIVLFVTAFLGKSRATRAFSGILSAMFLLGILVMQCRTAALGVAIAFIVFLVTQGRGRGLAMTLAVALLIVVALPSVQDFLTHAFFLDKYAGAGADAMSSGRLGLWGEALVELSGHELFGLGDYYTDNLYINLLANLGIVGFLMFMAVWIPRVVINVRKRPVGESGQSGLASLLVPLTVFYLFESLLEGFPPFGPGTCSFLFWMLCGCLDEHAVVCGRGGLR